MNWIKQNTFLAGFIAAMVVGVGVLGFLTMSAMGRYEEVQSEFEAKTAELNRLEGLKPYPEKENLAQFDEQKKEHASAIAALQKSLAENEIPVEPLSPEQFQDRLREAVTRVVTRANEKQVKPPEKFYLGFDRYQTEPPRPEAAPLLGRQLKAIELVVTQLVDAGVASINKLDRKPIKEEEDKPKKSATGKAGPGEKTDKGRDLVSAETVELEFSSEQNKFRTFLNALTSSKTQFFIPRLVQIKNEKEAAPSRVEFAGPQAIAAADPNTPPAVTDAAPGQPAETKKFVFGAEKVDVSIVLEIIDFAEVAAK